ncbi:hypothetical protein DEO72_LG6g718 [Vigna unguiculata]|uniref:Uncharacterized protein n=1 Tax=Vigna unguiculata TaxID=3917 RepID=A0A4D6M7B1_VIGUN|nr:hypothetical protein DEO72_LG6g718 [Vigna unguiculata]
MDSGYTMLPRTSPLIVQLYGPLRPYHLSSVSMKHTNLPARIPTREYQDMNLSTHTCSPPSMNLPAHGTTSPVPSLTSKHQTEIKKITLHYTRYILKLVLGILMLP